MEFKGKAIYKPKGKAGEYAEWACNFYNGCSNGCEYCYCKKGVLANTMGGNKPTLKKCFKDEAHALEVFKKELLQNMNELQKHGLFFSFRTDPMLPETIDLTLLAVELCTYKKIPVKILTKVAGWEVLKYKANTYTLLVNCDKIAFGFTLTGHDELEKGASTNQDRIETMKKLHKAGFKTFASIEPIIDIESSLMMIKETIGFCDLYKVGLESGRRYAWQDLRGMLLACYMMPSKFYFKDTFLSQAEMKRHDLSNNCVSRDYNLFESNH